MIILLTSLASLAKQAGEAGCEAGELADNNNY